MPKQVIHMFDIDFSTIKVDSWYHSLCGKGYIACEAPTPEQEAEIKERTKDTPVCKKCQKVRERERQLKGDES